MLPRHLQQSNNFSSAVYLHHITAKRGIKIYFVTITRRASYGGIWTGIHP
ncbi:hypothetical protein ACMGGR_19445 [Erwinia sp. BNK-24-b]